MLAEVLGHDLFLVLLFLVSLGLVVWAIVDAAKQPALSSGARAGWIIRLWLERSSSVSWVWSSLSCTS